MFCTASRSGRLTGAICVHAITDGRMVAGGVLDLAKTTDI